MALAIALSLASRSARADERCPDIDGAAATLATVEATARLAFIQDGLRRDAHDVRTWAWTWAGLYSGSTLANALRIPFSGYESRRDAAVATAGSLLGVAALGFLPLKVMADQRELDRLLVAPAGRGSCSLLADAERMLLRDAGSEEFGRGPLVHIGNFVLNLGLGLIIGLGFGHGTVAAISTLVGIVVGEIQIASQPTGSISLLERYRAGDLAPPSSQPPSATVSASAASGQGRFAVQLCLAF